MTAPKSQTTTQQNAEKAKQEQVIKQRQALENAYASLLGDQNIQTFSAFTLEEAVSLRLEKIEGKTLALRESELERVERIKSQVLQAIEQIRKVPPEEFQKDIDDDTVNSKP